MRILPVLLLLAFIPSVVFAFAPSTQDIGSLIFRDILKMSEYPGSPFTGNIVNDIVMFLLVPTVFIIVIVYTLAGRMTDNHKIDILLSITFYLFIVFGGYYSMFALLAGPYFLFMLIIVGLFLFFAGHFGLRRAGGGGGGAGHITMRGAGMNGSAVGGAALAQGETDLTLQLLRGARTFQGQISILDEKIRDLKAEYNEARKEGNDRLANSLQAQKMNLENIKKILEQQHRFNPTPAPEPI